MNVTPSEETALELEVALASAHRALRALETADPSDATLPAARSVRRAIGGLLDAIDSRTSLRAGLDRANGMLTLALAQLGAERGTGGDASLLESTLASVASLAASAAPSVLDAPATRPANRARPPFLVSTELPLLLDIPRSSLLPPDAIRLPPAAAEAPIHGSDTHAPGTDAKAGLDEAAMLRKAELLGIAGAALGVQAEAAVLPLPEMGAVPAGDLNVGSLLGDAETAMSIEAFDESILRQCFEDIGMFGLQRLPLFGDDWADVEPIERRLLASSDALLGETDRQALMSLERLARDTPAPDPMRVFAIAFVAGRLDGRDALAAAERTLYAHDPHDAVIADAFATALTLTSHPLATRVLTGLARAPEPAVRAAALRALSRCGASSIDLLVDAVDTAEPRVIAAALPALAGMSHPHATEILRTLADQHATSDDITLTVALLEALSLSGRDDGRFARARLAGPDGIADAAAIALAIAANEQDASLLLDHARQTMRPASLVALGWSGTPDAAPILIDALANDAVALAAARALERLLGGARLEATDIDPASLETMEPVAVRTPSLLPRGPLVTALQDQDEDAEGSLDEMMMPTRDAAFWKARYDTVRSSLPQQGKGLRLRRGEPYSTSMSIAELGQVGQELCPSYAERQLLVREICLRIGRPVAFFADDWVVRQRQQLAQLARY